MILAASAAGVAGGIAGNPAGASTFVCLTSETPSLTLALRRSDPDIILVRMTADAGKAPADRMNYKHCFDGLFRIVKEEGVSQLFRGLGPNLVRPPLSFPLVSSARVTDSRGVASARVGSSCPHERLATRLVRLVQGSAHDRRWHEGWTPPPLCRQFGCRNRRNQSVVPLVLEEMLCKVCADHSHLLF